MPTTSLLPIPPPSVPMFDPQTGLIDPLWSNYLLSLESLGGIVPPLDANYWVGTSDTDLTNERNLGALTTGYLKITSAAGAATPSTTTTIPAVDIAAGTAGISISGNAATATKLVTARDINGVAFDGTANITVTASANTLSGTALPAVSGAALTGLASTQISGLASGVYTPTLFNTTNVAASTAYQCQYLRVGATVTVSGKVDIDPTTTLTSTVLGVSLPIASDFGAAEDCGGTAFAPGIAAEGAAILADATNNRALVQWIASDVTNQSWFFSFTYRII